MRTKLPPPPPLPPLAYQVNEFCRRIGIGRTTLYAMMKDGQIKTVLIGGRRVVPATEADRLLSTDGSGEKIAA
jgi:excisionase family DNA binding protein